jgi:hypothetical protein
MPRQPLLPTSIDGMEPEYVAGAEHQLYLPVLRRILRRRRAPLVSSLYQLPQPRNWPASGPFEFGIDLKAGFDPGHNLNGA